MEGEKPIYAQREDSGIDIRNRGKVRKKSFGRGYAARELNGKCFKVKVKEGWSIKNRGDQILLCWVRRKNAQLK